MFDYCQMELIENLLRMKKVNIRQWLLEQDSRWSCRFCGSKLNTYDKICRHCKRGGLYGDKASVVNFS